MNTAVRYASSILLCLCLVAIADDTNTTSAIGAGAARARVRRRLLARAVQAGVLDVDALRAALTRQVRNEVQEFARAFNAHDAKAVAAQWSPRGVYIDSTGTEYQGRDAIEQLYAGLFAHYSNAQVRCDVDDVRLQNAFTAIERGRTTLTLEPGAESSVGNYVATHVRQGRDWLMVSVEDLPDAEQSAACAVQDLNWLIGTWKATTGPYTIETTFQPVSGGAFLQRTWTTCLGTNMVAQGTQLIGWEPQAKQIASWTYDAQGSVDKGLWSPDENGWSVAASGVLRDGAAFSATHQLQQTGTAAMTLRSVNRFVNDVAMPDLPEITLTRATP
jgi:uncharacterized protein (TIGR02246 family)